jgi:hypothetical protein
LLRLRPEVLSGSDRLVSDQLTFANCRLMQSRLFMWSVAVYDRRQMKLPFRSAIDQDGSALLERLDALIATQHQTNALLESLNDQLASAAAGRETSQPIQRASTSRPGRRTTRARGRKATGQRSESGGTKRSPGLHEEIEAVLREAGRPLPANEIADRIRQRGHYTPPRSSKPLSASSVNSRVANRTYRSRFVRRDDGIWLASAEVTPETANVG